MIAVNVRYGPSPTGIPHIGNIRTALFNFLYAKKEGGKFFLRIEDTDQKRIVPQAVEKIKKSLVILGLNWDGDIVFQSTRLGLYKKYLDILKDKGFAYEDEGAWRFKNKTENKNITWKDIVHGEVSFPSRVIEDFIIIKSDGFPTYHFASVVDDHEMQISHVMRGDEWISSTPKHILLYEALGWHHPQFAHLPPILGHDHKKLSKRDGAKSVLEYTQEGYLPEAIVNFMALLGWAPKDNREIFSLEELGREFSLDRINKNSPVFNIEKLNWFNGQWIRKMPDGDLAISIHNIDPALNPKLIAKVLPITKDRLNKVTDFPKIAGFFFHAPDIKNNLKEITVTKDVFGQLIKKYEETTSWNRNTLETVTNNLMETRGLKKPQLYRSIGIAVSGELVTPPIFDSLELLGKEETLKRMEYAAKKI